MNEPKPYTIGKKIASIDVRISYRIATSEVLMEAHLYAAGFEESAVRDMMARRDNLLRYLARSSGKGSARLIAQALEDAATDKNQLELEVVRAFDSMGFDAIPLREAGFQRFEVIHLFGPSSAAIAYK